jgi:hypothetical protein
MQVRVVVARLLAGTGRVIPGRDIRPSLVALGRQHRPSECDPSSRGHSCASEGRARLAKDRQSRGSTKRFISGPNRVSS